MLLPSILWGGSSAAINSATVGSTSIVITGSRQTLPASIIPGQRMMHGTRTPPSNVVPFPSRSGPVVPP